jgi:hypothetical protein
VFTDELSCQQWRLIALQKSAEGIVLESQEGPNNEEDAAVWLQGGPLSPVLSNILLNDLDWELHRRGHKFVPLADSPSSVCWKQEGRRTSAGQFAALYRRLASTQSEYAEKRRGPPLESYLPWDYIQSPRSTAQGER